MAEAIPSREAVLPPAIKAGESAIDGGPGLPRPLQSKEHESINRGLLGKAVDKVGVAFTRLKNINLAWREKHGLPNDFDANGQPIDEASTPLRQRATSEKFSTVKRHNPNAGMDLGIDNPPTEDVAQEVAASGPTYPVVGGQDKTKA